MLFQIGQGQKHGHILRLLRQKDADKLFPSRLHRQDRECVDFPTLPSPLQQEAELEEIVKLVGYDSLSAPDRLTLESARSVREDYLQQNAFDDTDTYTSNKKQYMMLKMIMAFSKECRSALSNGVKVEKLFALPVSEKIARAKYVPEDQFEAYFKDTLAEIETSVANVVSEEVSA